MKIPMDDNTGRIIMTRHICGMSFLLMCKSEEDYRRKENTFDQAHEKFKRQQRIDELAFVTKAAAWYKVEVDK